MYLPSQVLDLLDQICHERCNFLVRVEATFGRRHAARTHQVRVHMTHIGHPLVGDPVYGRARKPLSETLQARNFARQALHAAHLGFIHPVTGNNIALDSELPADMRDLIDELRV